MTSVLLLAAFAQSLTVDIHARPAHDTIRIISEATGEKLEVDGVLRNEILVVRVKDAPLEETLAKIAEVTHGEWRLDKGVKHLFRPPATQKALEAKELAERTEAVKKALEPFLKTSEARPFDAGVADSLVRRDILRYQAMVEGRSTAEFKNLMSEMPMSRALRRMVLLIDPAEVARLGRGERAVFTNTPNSSQRSLPPAWKGAVESLVEEHVQLTAAGSRYRKNHPEVRGPTPGESGVTSAEGLKPLLVVQRRGNEAFDISLKFGDEAGRMLGAMGSMLNIAPELARSPELLEERPGEKASWVPSSTVRWFGGTADEPAAAREARTRPEVNDPLSWFALALLKPWAAAREVRLVACLPDRVALVRPPAEGAKLATVGGSIQIHPDLQVAESSGWLTVAPSRPAMASLERSDRKALGEFLRTVVSDRRIRLSVESLLAFKAPFSWDALRPDMVANGMGIPLRQGTPVFAQGYVERPFLQMLHSLTDGQLETMRTGGLRLDRLSPQQREQVSAAFFNLEVGREPYGTDPTEVAPRGLDAGALVGLHSEDEVVADGRPKGSDRSSAPLGAMRLAEAHFVSFRKEAPDLKDMEYRVGNRTTYNFFLVVDRHAPREIQFDDSAELAKGWVGVDGLSERFKALMTERYDMLRGLPASGKPPP